jgi:hypothetical protein
MQYSCPGNEDVETQLPCGDGTEGRAIWTENMIYIYILFTNSDYHRERVGVEVTV